MNKSHSSISPRKMPLQARSTQMVDTILESASRVLTRQGFAGYNTTAVAEHAGVSIGSVYQYFPNRDALTASLILQMHWRLLAVLREKLIETDGMPLERALFVLIDVSIPKDINAGKLARILEFEEERLPRGVELTEVERKIEALNVQFLRRYIRPSASGVKDLEIAAFDMVSIICGMIDANLYRADSLEGLTERITRAIVGYLKPLIW